MSADGRTPEQSLAELTEKIHSFVDEQYECWRDELVPALDAESVRVLGRGDLRPEAREYIEQFLRKDGRAAAHAGHRRSRASVSARAQQSALPGVSAEAASGAARRFIWEWSPCRARCRGWCACRRPRTVSNCVFLHDVVHAFAERLYHGYEILSAAAFRVTRNSNLYLEEEESRSLLESVDLQIHRRRKGSAVRLEIEAGANQEIVERLQANFRLSPAQVFRVDGPINLSRAVQSLRADPAAGFEIPPFCAARGAIETRRCSMFELVRKRNVLLHHPYDSYSTVVRFIESAAQDPDVLSIKQTLYRTSENSPIVRALIDAAARKEVAVVVELKARFDEASNIRWARNLQEAGVQVFHGVVGLKTHCKLALVARREPDGQIRRYAHLGTGNYNPSTARFYTDLSLLTSDTRLTSAVHHVFNYLTAHSERSQYSPLFVAPLNLGKNFLGLIDRETAHAKAGRPSVYLREIQFAARRKNHPGALSRVAGRRADRADRARRVRSAAGRSRAQQPDSRAQRDRAVSGAQPHLRLRQWRQDRAFSRQRRLDAAQYLRARRSDFPHQGSRAAATRFSPQVIAPYLADNFEDAHPACRTANTCAPTKPASSLISATAIASTCRNS